MKAFLIDTCAAIRLSASDEIGAAATIALDAAADRDLPVSVSPITTWEIGMLVSENRSTVRLPPERRFDRFLTRSGARGAGMAPPLLVASSFLPGTPPADPADRIIAATARDPGATLITRNRLLLAYGKQGHLKAIAC